MTDKELKNLIRNYGVDKVQELIDVIADEEEERKNNEIELTEARNEVVDSLIYYTEKLSDKYGFEFDFNEIDVKLIEKLLKDSEMMLVKEINKGQLNNDDFRKMLEEVLFN